MRLKSSWMTMLSVVAASCAFAETFSGNGTLTVDTLTTLNGYNPLYLGTGTIRYLGESGTYTGTLTFNGPKSKAGTIDVDTGKVLTLTSVSTPTASATNGFVKTGTGELVLQGVTAQRFGCSYIGAGTAGSTPHWDANGNFDTNADGSLLVLDGTLTVDGGSPRTLGNILVGSRGTNAPCLKLVNGATLTTDGALYVARGTQAPAADKPVKVLLDGGSTLDAKACSTGWSNYMPTPYLPRTLIDVRGESWLKLGGGERFFCGQSGGYHDVVVTESSKLTSERDSTTVGGLVLGDSSATTTTVSVTDHSLLGGYSLSVRNTASLSMTDSTLAFDRSAMTHYASTSVDVGGVGRGSVFLDGVTLTNYTAHTLLLDWFTRQTNVAVGAKGLVVDSSSADAVMDGILTPVKNTSGQTVTKRGMKRVALRPTAIPVTAAQGPLAFYTGSQRTRAYNDANSTVPAATVTGAAGENIDGLGEGAFANLALAHPNGTLRLLAQGEEAHLHGWKCVGDAWVMPGGVIRLTPGETAKDTSGITLNREKVRVDESFTIHWDYFANYTTSTCANGCFLFFETAPGFSITSVGSNWGLSGLTKSFAVGFENGARAVRFVENGVYSDDATHKLSIGLGGKLFPDVRTNAAHCTLAYDAVQHKARFTFGDSRGYWEYEYDVNLATVCAANEAYFGFSAANQKSYPTEHCVEHVRFERATAKTGATPMGGRLTVAAGATQAVTLVPDGTKAGFTMNGLTYADGATLDVGVESADSYRRTHAALDLTNPDLWKKYGANGTWQPVWNADGSVQLSCNEKNPNITSYNAFTSGGIVTQDYYPMNGDWTIDYDFDLGTSSKPAADVIYFNVGTGLAASTQRTSTGLTLHMRYYNAKTVPTHLTTLSLYKNNSLQTPVGQSTNVLTLGTIDLQKQRQVHVNLAYVKATQQLTVTLSNTAGTESFTYGNIDCQTLFSGWSSVLNRTEAQFSFLGEVGGSWAQNKISHFTVSCAAQARSQATDDRLDDAYLAFDSLAGAGTLVKQGAGAFAFTDPAATPVSALRVEEGGLRLMKRSLDPFTVAGSGFVFSDWDGSYSRANGVSIGRFGRSNQAVSANSRRRVRVDKSWRCTFSLDLRHPTNNDTAQADAIAFFLHNSSRGNEVCGLNYGSAGFSGGGINKSACLRWFVYKPGGAPSYGRLICSDAEGANSITKYYDTTTGGEGCIRMYGRVTDVTIAWDRTTKNLTVTMARTGEASVTNTFENVDIPAKVGDSYAYLGLSTGGGGSQTEPAFNDFRFETTEALGDTLAASPYAQAVTLTAAETPVVIDSTVANGVYRLANTVSLTAADPVVTARAADAAGTLALGAVTTAGETVTFRAEDGAKISVDAVNGAKRVTVTGGTLVVNAVNAFDADVEIYLVNGAKVQLDFAGVLHAHRIYVDGVSARGAFGAGDAAWIAGGTGRVCTVTGTLLLLR